MSKTIKLILICLTLSFGAVQVQAAPNSPPADQSQATAKKPAQQVKFVALKGKVVETMDSGGYTYLRLDYNGTKYWAAIPKTKVEVGSNVTVSTGMVMHNFTSSSLHRTFDTIVFSQGLVKE